jgi:ribosomal protein S12 methylthiotransferase
MPKAALQNLGCSKNLVDGDRIIYALKTAGYEITEDFSDAEIIVVNTCSFIREAQEEAIESILDCASYKNGGKCTTLIVSGCFSERYRKEVADKFPEVDLWVGVNDWETVFKEKFSTKVKKPFERKLEDPIASQYLKIAEGCSHGCTFCVIPSIRGKFISRTDTDILEEAQWLYENGTKELILVAQDSSFYGRDTNSTLQKLLEKLLAKTLFPWIRVMYLHPKYVDNSLLSLFAKEDRLCSYFDIPLQHISDPVLKAMNRPTQSKDIYALIDNIRSIVPDAAIRSAFILGFPGETEKDFSELQQFVEHARFDKLGVFPYSAEEGTKAYEMRPRPKTSTATRRCEELMLIQRDISRELLEAKVGKTIEVIIDRVAEDPDFNYEARSRHDAPEVDGKVLITEGNADIGSIVPVQIIGCGDYDLYGKVITKP